MSSSSSLSNISSSSSKSSFDDSSVIRFKDNKDKYYEYKKERKNLQELMKRGKMLKAREN